MKTLFSTCCSVLLLVWSMFAMVALLLYKGASSFHVLAISLYHWVHGASFQKICFPFRAIVKITFQSRLLNAAFQMTSFLQFSLVRRLSDYKWHSCQVYIDQIQRCLLYMLSTCFQCVFWSFLLSCSASNQTKLITLCPTSTGMKLGPCAAASNPWLFFRRHDSSPSFCSSRLPHSLHFEIECSCPK